MWGYSSQLTLVALALSLVSCTVAPVLVFAEETLTITNVARSSVSTGGQDGQDGTNGTDGQAGEDGRDGADGEAGVSVSNHTSGTATEYVKIESTINGQVVADYESTETSLVEARDESRSGTGTVAVVANDIKVTSNNAVSTHTTLTQLFVDLKVIIFTYVSYLF